MMNPDTNDAIKEAVQAAGISLSDDPPDTGGDDGEEELGGGGESDSGGGASGGSEVSGGAEGEKVSAKAAPAAAGVSDPDDLSDEQLEEILKAYGVSAISKRGREGVYERSRVRKVLGRELAKAKKKHDGDLMPLKEKLTLLEKNLATYGEVDRLFAADPERALKWLDVTFPGKYSKYLTPAEGAAAAKKEIAATASDFTEEMPGPDSNDGYTPAGFRKAIEWAVRKGAAEGEARVSKRLKPFEDREVKAAQRAAMQPTLESQTQWAAHNFGDFFLKDVGDLKSPNPKARIIQAINENVDNHIKFNRPLKSFEALCLELYGPLQKAAHDEELKGLKKQKQEYYDEFNKDLAKQPRNTNTSGGNALDKGDEEMSLHDVIAKAARKAGAI